MRSRNSLLAEIRVDRRAAAYGQGVVENEPATSTLALKAAIAWTFVQPSRLGLQLVNLPCGSTTEVRLFTGLPPARLMLRSGALPRKTVPPEKANAFTSPVSRLGHDRTRAL